jgi:ubiquinone/menaquinone biosynthesis C-methylase UbiE
MSASGRSSAVPPKSARYDEIAEFYSSTVGDRVSDPATAALLDLVPGKPEARILDLACGHGRVARELARRGGRAVGVDLSSALLERARAAEDREPLAIEYIHGDVTERGVLEGEVFDGVVCNFGLTDIDDLAAAIATVARVLGPDGFFVFSILHPCFPGAAEVSASWSPDGGYYQEEWWRAEKRLSQLRQRAGSNHRMLSTYLNTLRQHGLAVDEVAEPPPNQQWLDERPDAVGLPLHLVIRCRKAPT